MARRLGATPEQLAGVEKGSYDSFEPAWRAALEWADRMTPTGPSPSEQDFAAIAAHWSEPQIVEITAVISAFNYFNRFAEALAIPPTR